MSAQYEYKIEVVEPEGTELAKQLNKYGSEGWRVTTFVPMESKMLFLILEKKISA